MIPKHIESPYIILSIFKEMIEMWVWGTKYPILAFIDKSQKGNKDKRLTMQTTMS